MCNFAPFMELQNFFISACRVVPHLKVLTKEEESHKFKVFVSILYKMAAY